jgi:phosphatidylglycerol:prolipoprotein diacylglycerol transferase
MDVDEISGISTQVPIYPAYSISVLLGLALIFLFPVTKNMSASDKRSYLFIQLIMIVGAILGAKLAVLMGDALWPLKPFTDWHALLTSGRSIMGALLIGFLVAEFAKPLIHYKLPPNDRFAVILPFSIAMGRIGCYLAGCCRGIPYDGPFSIAYDDHVQRHAIQLYEMGFHLACGLLLIYLYRRKLLAGRLFVLYLVIYGIFRFATEYLRVTEKAFWGYSAYQLFALAMITTGLVFLYIRRHYSTKTWGGVSYGQ